MRAAVGLLAVQAWDYLTGGANWQEGICGQGDRLERQSPIALPEAPSLDAQRKLVYTYPVFEEPVKIRANDHSVSVTFPETYKAGFADVASVMDVRTGGNLFRLRTMVLHAPGEHRYGDQQPRLEVQLFHEQGFRVGGIAIPFIDGGPASRFLSVLLEQPLPSEPWAENHVNMGSGWSIAELIQGAAFDAYVGSLTEPPCDQNVDWFVRATPIAVSHAQLQELEVAIKKLSPPRGNARDPQPLKGRTVTRIVSQDFHSEDTMTEIEDISVDLETLGVPEEPDPIGQEDILNNPAFSQIFADDSETVQHAKTMLATAAQDLAGATSAVMSAKANLGAQQGMYEASDGLVGKITQMWNVLAAKQGFQAAVADRAHATGKYAAALEQALSVINAEVEKLAAQNKTTQTAESLKDVMAEMQKAQAKAAADKEKAAKELEALGGLKEDFSVEQPTVLPGQTLAYRSGGGAKPSDSTGGPSTPAPPAVVPMQHEAHNPFDPTVAERTVRIGPGPSQQRHGYEDVRSNLRQPNGPEGLVPHAVLKDTPDAANATGDAAEGAIAPAAEGGDAGSAALLHPNLRAAPARRAGAPRAWWEPAR